MNLCVFRCGRRGAAQQETAQGDQRGRQAQVRQPRRQVQQQHADGHHRTGQGHRPAAGQTAGDILAGRVDERHHQTGRCKSSFMLWAGLGNKIYCKSGYFHAQLFSRFTDF